MTILTQKILHAAIPSDACKNFVANRRHVAQAFDIDVGECRFFEGLVKAIDLITLEKRQSHLMQPIDSQHIWEHLAVCSFQHEPSHTER